MITYCSKVNIVMIIKLILTLLWSKFGKQQNFMLYLNSHQIHNKKNPISFFFIPNFSEHLKFLFWTSTSQKDCKFNVKSSTKNLEKRKSNVFRLLEILF